jgi:Cu+-exporting ATPase
LLLRRWNPPAPVISTHTHEGVSTMYELTVDGMSCAHCTGRVTKAIQAIDQGATVAIDLATKRVTIDSSAPVQVLANAIDEAGYPVLAKA